MTRLIALSASDYEVGVLVDGRVGLKLTPFAGEQIGIAAGYQVAISLSPSESRQLAQALVRKADEAEGGSPRH